MGSVGKYIVGAIIAGGLITALVLYLRPAPHDRIAIDESQLEVQSMTFDGEIVSDWPAELAAGQRINVEFVCRHVGAEGPPESSDPLNPSLLLFRWMPKEDYDSTEQDVVSLLAEARTHEGMVGGMQAKSGLFMDGRPVQVFEQQPAKPPSPEGWRTYQGQIVVPSETGEYAVFLSTNERSRTDFSPEAREAAATYLRRYDVRVE